MWRAIVIAITFISVSCNWNPPSSNEGIRVDTVAVADSFIVMDSLAAKTIPSDTQVKDQLQNKDTAALPRAVIPDTKNTKPSDIVAFAKTLIGVPYVWGSTDPKVGFDCSGFITHVFNHFNIKVPRSSIDFTHVGKEIDTTQAVPGDLILFTGTNPMEKHVGHMGIVVSNVNRKLEFIHSTSGKAMSVTISPLENYYRTRFVKVIRIF